MVIEKYQEKDIVICTVKNIIGTTVFVETEEGIKGSIVLSEIATGRIRNLREYVVPNKVIVCKILQIKDNYLFLSLRRVKSDERKQVLEQYKKEKTWCSIIKKIAGEKGREIIPKIKESETLNEFFENAKQNAKSLENYFTKNEIGQFLKILKERKEKEKEIKKKFSLSCGQSNGIIRIKKILANCDNINYLGGSNFQIKIKSTDLKKADHTINEILQAIEKQAKKEKCEFSSKK